MQSAQVSAKIRAITRAASGTVCVPARCPIRQWIQVGLPHAGKTVTISVGSDTYQITMEDGITIAAPRKTGLSGISIMCVGRRANQLNLWRTHLNGVDSSLLRRAAQDDEEPDDAGDRGDDGGDHPGVDH